MANAFLDTSNDRSAFTGIDLDIFRDNAAAPGALRAMINYYRAMVVAAACAASPARASQ